MQFLNISRTKSTITYTFSELKKLEETEHSCVEKVTRRLHLTLLPFHLSNIVNSITEILSSNVTKYNKDLDGILLGYKNVRVLDSTPAIHNDNCLIHVTIDADFYLFKPCEGKNLIGIVNQISDDHIGCLVHKAFNVVIPKEQDGFLVRKNQHILVNISYTNLEAKLPYIKADLISVVSDTDSGISTGEENHHDTSILQDIPEIFIQSKKTSKVSKKKRVKHDQYPDDDNDGINYVQPPKKKKRDKVPDIADDYILQKDTINLPSKKKKKKKSKSYDETEYKEEFHPSKVDQTDTYRTEDNADVSIKKTKKKKSKEKKKEEPSISEDDTELLPSVPKIKQKKHKKKKYSIDELDNCSVKALEVGGNRPFVSDIGGSEKEQPTNEQGFSKGKPLKFKILQNIIIKSDQMLKLNEDSFGKTSKNVSLIDEINPKRKSKHKKENLEDSSFDSKQKLLENTSDRLTSPLIGKKEKHKKSKKNKDQNLGTSNEKTLDLIQDLKHEAFQNALYSTTDSHKIKKHKKSKNHDFDQENDRAFRDKSESDLIENPYAFDNSIEEESVNSNKLKKRKKSKQNQSKDDTLDLIEDLKRKALENALGESLDKTKKHKRSKHDSVELDLNKSDETVFEIENLSKKSKRKKSKDTKNQDLDTSNDSTIDIIEDLKRKALENALRHVPDPDKKTKPKRMDSKEDENVVNVNLNNKKAKKTKKCDKDVSSTKHLDVNESEIDDIRHNALAQALSKITDSPEANAGKKRKRKHKDELDINELKSETLQKILANKENEISGDKKKKHKKKETCKFDIDEMKSIAIDKLLLDKNKNEEKNAVKRKKKTMKNL